MRGRRGGQNQRVENATLLGFEDGRRVVRQEYGLLEAGKGREMNSSLDFPGRMQLYE